MSLTSSNDNDDKNNDKSDIYGQKQALRKEIRAKVKSMTSDEINSQSQLVWDRVVALPSYQEAKTIGLFLSMPKNEIQTNSIVQHAIQQGKLVHVPEVGANFEQADMELIQCPTSNPTFFEDWPTNKWNIPEPPLDYKRIPARPGDLDLLIVPGLAFDREGGRLGQGKGYYDRFIARMRHNEEEEKEEGISYDKPTLVAVCMEPQLLDPDRRIPTTELDYRMEMIVTPQETIHVSTTDSSTTASTAGKGDGDDDA
eukprot:CAMPEP_0116577624 /NCGR_PEP_ID=MMETSP0397-20121206/21254_1 /TAXON_ID=216820 /ORGANISM="Cyclophora tenuis, Strain ECT3854" /LENGTH=254 /DNA_ID=CAMNT_0004106923 /DNA_START=14 /DNA_END=778 /DNA_ORIENTATION=+